MQTLNIVYMIRTQAQVTQTLPAPEAPLDMPQEQPATDAQPGSIKLFMEDDTVS